MAKAQTEAESLRAQRLKATRLPNAPEVVVTESWNDKTVPDALKDDIRKASAQDVVNGAFHNGKIYLFADMQQKLAEVEEKERIECLDQMKEWQRRYRFTQRELGTMFKRQRPRKTE